MSSNLEKWDIVEGVVVRQAPYGLLVELTSGEVGVVDSLLINDLPVKRDEWPKVGNRITVVVEGRTSGSKFMKSELRLSARESHLNLAQARKPAKDE